ncbi:MAG: hypothetical protein FWE82_07750, partial [Defluviitaleaceae bacterium]|nr:hypothetical protein [Defluviitaleaceae bacterium]
CGCGSYDKGSALYHVFEWGMSKNEILSFENNYILPEDEIFFSADGSFNILIDICGYNFEQTFHFNFEDRLTCVEFIYAGNNFNSSSEYKKVYKEIRRQLINHYGKPLKNIEVAFNQNKGLLPQYLTESHQDLKFKSNNEKWRLSETRLAVVHNTYTNANVNILVVWFETTDKNIYENPVFITQ